MTHDNRPLIIAITGPTASGKTALAMELTKHLPIELINMDSAQVYRDMDIGTAKITAEEKRYYPHHLMDIISPEETYSASQFVADVHQLVPQITARGNTPVVVGGTPLYYKALQEGLADLPSADEVLRTELRATLVEYGHQVLLAELAEVDPKLAASIQGKDSQRLVRFVEIARLTGRAPSELFAEHQASGLPSAFRFLHVCFFPEDRQWLHDRIALRFDMMLDEGFIEEVQALRSRYNLSLENASMRCAGYRQAWEYLDGAYDNLPQKKHNKPTNTPRQELRDRGIFATRQLAKRQLTWLRKMPADIRIAQPQNIDVTALAAEIKRMC